jgi:hypothetical protein
MDTSDAAKGGITNWESRENRSGCAHSLDESWAQLASRTLVGYCENMPLDYPMYLRKL